MDARDSATTSTAANADLWAGYLRVQWGGWLRLAGLGDASDEIARSAADAAGATIAAVVSAWLGGPVARMYAANAPGVTAFVDGASLGSDPPAEDAVVPLQYMRTRARAGESQLEEWRPAVGAREEVLAY
jgi:hypothetical protein